MRRSRLSKASPQSVCLFCACRLSGITTSSFQPSLFPTLSPPTRSVSSTRPSSQQAEALLAPRHRLNETNEFTFKVKGSLSASEQRERAAILRRRQHAEQEAVQQTHPSQRPGQLGDGLRRDQQRDTRQRHQVEQSRGRQASGRSQAQYMRTDGGRDAHQSNSQKIRMHGVDRGIAGGRATAVQSPFRSLEKTRPATPRKLERPQINPFAASKPVGMPSLVSDAEPDVVSSGSGAGGGWGSGAAQRLSREEGERAYEQFKREQAQEAERLAQETAAALQDENSKQQHGMHQVHSRGIYGPPAEKENLIERAMKEQIANRLPRNDGRNGSFGRNPQQWQAQKPSEPEQVGQRHRPAEEASNDLLAPHLKAAGDLMENIESAKATAQRQSRVQLQPTESHLVQRETRQSYPPAQAQPGQSRMPTFDDIISQPPSAPLYGDTGYEAKTIASNELQQLRPTAAFDDPSANWQHLRRRSSGAGPDGQAPPQAVQRQHDPVTDDAWVDRRFEEYKQQRRAYQQQQDEYAAKYRQEQHSLADFRLQPQQTPSSSPQDNPNIANATFDPRFAETMNKRCGRCGQLGHVVTQCKLPNKKCYNCGLIGHVARDCPTTGPTRVLEEDHDQRLSTAFGTPFNRGPVNGSVNLQSGDSYRQKQGADPFRDLDDDADPFASVRDRHGRRLNGRGGQSARDAMSESIDEGMASPAPRSDRFAARDEEEQPKRRGRFRAMTEETEEHDKRPARRGRRRQDADEDDLDERSGRRTQRSGEELEQDNDFEDGFLSSIDEDRTQRKSNRRAEKERARKMKERKAAKAARKAGENKIVELPEFISVQNLAQTLGVRYEIFVEKLEDLGYDDVFPGKILNTETSGMIAMEYDLDPVFPEANAKVEEEERDLKSAPEVSAEDLEYLPTRPPVVTIMGHVDHGKTTILDYLRKSSIAAGEAGGITQHIGAFSVPMSSSGKTITFLDTPGHAAFLAMRQRGANVTDIVILVVAADDSVKPQTLEAIKHAKAAGVPMIVAVNKIDKPEADLQKVKQDLARHGVEIEDYGGETQVVPVSGKTGQGMDELEENVVALSELLDHRADVSGNMEGWVLEATTKKAGRVATVLVRRGTLRQGTVIVAGKTWARVRSLKNEAGVAVSEVGPGMPVEIDGWRNQPAAGDEVLQAPNEQKATSVVEYRLELEEREQIVKDMEAINEARRLEQEKREREKAAAQAAKDGTDVEAQPPTSEREQAPDPTKTQREVPFIIKADVSGSAEALEAYLLTITNPLITPTILNSEVGQINESDIELASAAKGHIIAFNLTADEQMRGQAEARGVKVLGNNIIYRVLDDVKVVLEDMLPPIISQRVLGEAEVGAAFEIGIGGRKSIKIAGCKVRNGSVGKGSRVRVLRGDEKVYDGTIESLKNVKKDVTEMRKGTECGMGFDGWEAFEVGDQVQTYEEKSEKRKL